ncbi:type VI secretion system effector Dnase Tse7 [Cocleimonas flava]|uniref:HNH/endonuclease VII toxin of polymorphic toxin system n=1 Tax=Cocleimonas flava TaxID=634765 RepID=A0A4R1EZZ4_9GAMM|nr:PAAR-like domain-containing protein [Cocleimonas flava]TCJ87487.1 HNH/endonuclease VII toxin of polymorphic toxin system [Cocleimonas flava]
MSNDVFANGREISCKKADGKTICAFPDVCMTPPTSPATPMGVPVPYPNTGMAKDTTKGSKSVKITGKEIIKKNVSHYKTSYGDEAGCATPAKKGIITGTIKGKVYFKSWSMDVKVEGKNVVRHLDMTTHNHKSEIGNESIPWPHVDSMSIDMQKACAADIAKEKTSCADYKPKGDNDVCVDAGLDEGITKSKSWAKSKSISAKSNACIKARRCRLAPYSKKKDGINGCCPAQTADHLIPKSSFYKTTVKKGTKLTGWKNYTASGAPCICAEGGTNTQGTHGLRHTHHKINGPAKGTMVSLESQASLGAKGVTEVFPESNCNEECIKNQLIQGHKKMTSGKNKDAEIKHSPCGTTMDPSELTTQIQTMAPSGAR